MAEKVKINILQALIDGGLDEDAAKKAKSIIDKDILPKNYIPSDQYNDKVLELADTKRDLKTAQDDLVVAKGFETKYNDEVTAHNATKSTNEAEKTVSTKRQALHKQLERDGANPKLIDLLESKFDLDELEIDDTGIKKWDEISKPVKEAYSEVFGKITTTGAGVATPPANANTGAYSGKTATELMEEANKSPDKLNDILSQIEAMNKQKKE